MSGYELSRYWFDWVFENPDLVSSNDTALYLWLVEKNNRCGWSEKFSVSSTESMSACGFKTYPPYKKSFDRLIELGFIIMVKRSINQFQSNVIALSKNNKAIVKALDKASLKHPSKHLQSSSESTFDINKQETIETNKPETNKPKFIFLGEFENIKIETEKSEDLNNRYPKEKLDFMIKKLDSWLQTKKKKSESYKSLIAYFNNWVEEGYENSKPQIKRAFNHGIPVN